MNKTPEYLETSTGPKEISARLRVPDNLAQTEGHFEDAPIVPGVVLIDWAMSLAEMTFPNLPDLSEIRNVKFKKPLQPGDTCSLEITLNTEENTLQFSYMSGEEPCAAGTCRLKDS